MDARRVLTRIGLLLGATGLLVWGADQGRAQIPAPDISMPNYANSPLLRKFVDSLPGLTDTYKNNLQQYIPVANADKNKYPGSDYYEIGVTDHREQMHSDLPGSVPGTGTKIRGYYQINEGKAADGTVLPTDHAARYLGPLIIATKGTPVRIKLVNQLDSLPAGTPPPTTGPRPGDLVIPVDTTDMGAGMGPLDMPGMPGMRENFTQNRATLHLHGGFVPWISDGTPHQWTVPADESTSYKKGVSAQDVPDMIPAGSQPGELTFFYPNQQSGRLMFYHDHSWGITRLNVYAGEAAGYLVTDPVERALTDGTVAGLPAMDDIPLIIQDKTFVPSAAQLAATDPMWQVGQTNYGWGGEGDLWFPNVYTPNQDPYGVNPNTGLDGMNPVGRWDYGPWIWPPALAAFPLPWPSHVMEAFMDTPVVNGTAYPYVVVEPKAYRLRILNAGNDRGLNLQLYCAKSQAPMWNADGTLNDANAGEVPMVPANGLTYAGPYGPYTVEFDGRDGGVPHPGAAGPAMIQIGSEGGILPQAVVQNAPPVPISWDRNPKSMTVGNVDGGNLMLGPAERADIVVDFSQYAGQTLILYNDGPAAWPAPDPRYDYYTGNPDLTFNGGAPPTQPGYGPNTRTVMQIRVKAADPVNGTGVSSISILDGGVGYSAPVVSITGGGGAGATADATPVNGVITSITVTDPGAGYTSAPTVTITDTAPGVGSGATAMAKLTPGTAYNGQALIDALPAAYGQTQEKPLVPAAAYGTAFGTTYPNKYARIFDGALSFTSPQTGQNVTVPFQTKAIAEEFEPLYGRMNALLGTEWWTINNQGQQTNGFAYIDPSTEEVPEGQVQIWKIVHNGVDTHAIHFHLVNVQVINRTDWAGVVKPPDPNELGWKETIRMNPLEDCFVAVKPVRPALPADWAPLPDNVRPLDPTSPLGSTTGFTQPFPSLTNPNGVTTVNRMQNFGWEYVWHCHLLGHEEMDMMRPVALQIPHDTPAAPTLLTATLAGTPLLPLSPLQGPPPKVNLTWLDNSTTEYGFRIERATVVGGVIGAYAAVGTANPWPGTGGTVSFTDTTVAAATTYAYRVVAFVVNPTGNPDSPSNVLQVTTPTAPAAPSSLKLTPSKLSVNPPTVTVSWKDNANNEVGFVIERGLVVAGTPTTYAPIAAVAANVTTFVDKTVAPKTTYAYRVRAFNQGAYSAYTGVQTVTTAGQLPAAPTGLTVGSPTTTTLTVSWTPGAGGGPVQGYTLQRSTRQTTGYDTIATLPGGTTSYTDGTVTPLKPNTTYWYQVRAFNVDGNSGWSNRASGTTLP